MLGPMHDLIHPTAIVHPKARLDSTVRVGPYSMIDADVTMGPNCMVGPYVHITGVTVIGSDNQFFDGCVIGEAPQDLKYRGEPTKLRIGDRNVFREHFTVHRSTKSAEETVIGSDNFLMANGHVAHNCTLGDHVILANGALLAGHVAVGNGAFISGNCLAHQYVRIGTLALMQGGSAISKDLPPYTIARGDNGICGLNFIGLRRAGISAAERLELKRIYLTVLRGGKNTRTAVKEAQALPLSGPAKNFVDFIATSKRGICRDTGTDDAIEPE
jgi:UDP-N-acetylglucosamine acyltransferase